MKRKVKNVAGNKNSVVDVYQPLLEGQFQQIWK